MKVISDIIIHHDVEHKKALWDMWDVLQCSKAVAKHVVGLSQHWFISTLVF